MQNVDLKSGRKRPSRGNYIVRDFGGIGREDAK
jgi:hypothetical protein